MKLNERKSLKPLYVQLVEEIKKNINSGKHSVGSKLPTENELCEIYGVSRITIRRAITELEEQGVVLKQHGIGTFVLNQHKIKRDLVSVNGFSEFLVQSGKQPATKILSKQVTEANEIYADILKVNIGDPILKIRRLHLVDNDPIHLESSYYSLLKFPDLDKFLEESSSIYSILKNRYGVQAVKNTKTLNVIQPSIEQANLLNCTQDNTIYRVEKIAYDSLGEPIHYAKSYLPTDKVTFTITTD
ncbi:UTRA domain-containing protein [Neobacillus niacini]|uniref:UTRA domain-containing protein n=1 Tax=Neobacillus niacini TaxID=86668 RepID=UPI00398349E1